MDRSGSKSHERLSGARPRRPGRMVVGADELAVGIANAQEDEAAVSAVALSDQPLDDRYPERRMPIAGAVPEFMTWTADDSEEGRALRDLQERYQRFCDVRSELLQDYCLNTARAYWGDLDDIWRWAEKRGKDVLTLTDKEVRQYVALLRRRNYSDTTLRRRLVTYAAFRRVLCVHLGLA